MTTSAAVTLVFALSYLWRASCDLNLDSGSPCVTQGVNGTCIDVLRCNSAGLTYLYRNAGFNDSSDFPELPDVCSYSGDKPVVCCTDCGAPADSFVKSAVGPLGVLVNTGGSLAKSKCYDYFSRLPYPCRGIGNVRVNKIWKPDKQCHRFEYSVALAVGVGPQSDGSFPTWRCSASAKRLRLRSGFAVAPSSASVTSSPRDTAPTHEHCKGTVKFAALGLLKRSDPLDQWKVYNITRIVTHPEYKPPLKYHDIALLQTDTQIIFGKDLLPACLHIGGDDELSAEAAGWGQLGYKQPVADTLQVVYLSEFNESTCRAMYQPHRHLPRGYDHHIQMCYGSDRKIVDTCQGDSGGPLQTNKFKCLYSVKGVTSYGKDCGVLGSAGVYTRVSHYVPWIEGIVWPTQNDIENN